MKRSHGIRRICKELKEIRFSMKKIFLCIPTLNLAGAEKFVVDLALNINKEMFQVYIVITYSLCDSVLKDQLTHAGIVIIDCSGKKYILRLMRMLKQTAMIRPDIIHTNIGSLLHMLPVMILCRTKRRIYTIHSSTERIYGGNLIKKWIYRIAFKYFRVVPVAISNHVKETAMIQFKLKSKDIFKIYNGVDTEYFQSSISHKNTGKITCISTGSLYYIKNHKLILKSLSKIIEKNSKVNLILVGDGELKNELKIQAEQLRIKENVDFVGQTSDVKQYLEKADIFILSSLTEGFSIATLEAMSMGIPIIATDCGGVLDIVLNNYNGFIVKNNDEYEMRKAILELVSNENLRKEMGRLSRKQAEKFSLKKCVQEYEKLYLEEY